MRRATNASVRIFAETFDPQGPIIEIGSFYQPGAEETCDLRRYFQGKEYIGCDIRRGLGVDRIENAHALSFSNGSARTVLLFEILEHLPDPWRAVEEARRILSDDGLVAVSVPFNYRLHGFPTDYWRFTASGVYTLLSAFPDKVVFALGPRLKPAFIFAVAGKIRSDSFSEKRVRFQSAINEEFKKAKVGGHISVFKERARDLIGQLLGRAELSVNFYDSATPGGYLNQIHESDS